MILNLKDINKSYKQAHKELTVLDGLQLQIEEPKSIAILGKSGAGKSTLLSLLGGLDKPNNGEIIIGSKNIVNLSEAELAVYRSQNIGIVFQEFHLMKTFTALENVMLPLEILKEKNVLERAKKALELVQLGERANHFPHELSGGECQRVAIARAVVTEPQIILADEPSGNLDTDTGELVMDMIFNLVKDLKRTLILVTHDRDLAKKCDEMYELKERKLEKIQ
tara:strand:- start:8271 stop:8939 length:669 start_codon:yes stop_codon:yes gene_type:complete